MPKSLKLFFFLIHHMIRDRFGIRAWISFLRNSIAMPWFQGLLPNRHRDDVEIHVLCQEADMKMLSWALGSFLHHLEAYPKVVVHSDGSITNATSQRFCEVFSRAKILHNK